MEEEELVSFPVAIATEVSAEETFGTFLHELITKLLLQEKCIFSYIRSNISTYYTVLTIHEHILDRKPKYI